MGKNAPSPKRPGTMDNKKPFNPAPKLTDSAGGSHSERDLPDWAPPNEAGTGKG